MGADTVAELQETNALLREILERLRGLSTDTTGRPSKTKPWKSGRETK